MAPTRLPEGDPLIDDIIQGQWYLLPFAGGEEKILDELQAKAGPTGTACHNLNNADTVAAHKNRRYVFRTPPPEAFAEMSRTSVLLNARSNFCDMFRTKNNPISPTAASMFDRAFRGAVLPTDVDDLAFKLIRGPTAFPEGSKVVCVTKHLDGKYLDLQGVGADSSVAFFSKTTTTWFDHSGDCHVGGILLHTLTPKAAGRHGATPGQHCEVPEPIRLHARVELVGLRATHLNGVRATIVSAAEADNGRWAVRVTPTGPKMAIKTQNLRCSTPKPSRWIQVVGYGQTPLCSPIFFKQMPAVCVLDSTTNTVWVLPVTLSRAVVRNATLQTVAAVVDRGGGFVVVPIACAAHGLQINTGNSPKEILVPAARAAEAAFARHEAAREPLASPETPPDPETPADPVRDDVLVLSHGRHTQLPDMLVGHLGVAVRALPTYPPSLFAQNHPVPQVYNARIRPGPADPMFAGRLASAGLVVLLVDPDDEAFVVADVRGNGTATVLCVVLLPAGQPADVLEAVNLQSTAAASQHSVVVGHQPDSGRLFWIRGPESMAFGDDCTEWFADQTPEGLASRLGEFPRFVAAGNACVFWGGSLVHVSEALSAVAAMTVRELQPPDVQHRVARLVAQAAVVCTAEVFSGARAAILDSVLAVDTAARSRLRKVVLGLYRQSPSDQRDKQLRAAQTAVREIGHSRTHRILIRALQATLPLGDFSSRKAQLTLDNAKRHGATAANVADVSAMSPSDIVEFLWDLPGAFCVVLADGGVASALAAVADGTYGALDRELNLAIDPQLNNSDSLVVAPLVDITADAAGQHPLGGVFSFTVSAAGGVSCVSRVPIPVLPTFADVTNFLDLCPNVTSQNPEVATLRVLLRRMFCESSCVRSHGRAITGGSEVLTRFFLDFLCSAARALVRMLSGVPSDPGCSMVGMLRTLVGLVLTTAAAGSSLKGYSTLWQVASRYPEGSWPSVAPARVQDLGVVAIVLRMLPYCLWDTHRAVQINALCMIAKLLATFLRPAHDVSKVLANAKSWPDVDFKEIAARRLPYKRWQEITTVVVLRYILKDKASAERTRAMCGELLRLFPGNPDAPTLPVQFKKSERFFLAILKHYTAGGFVGPLPKSLFDVLRHTLCKRLANDVPQFSKLPQEDRATAALSATPGELVDMYDAVVARKGSVWHFNYPGTARTHAQLTSVFQSVRGASAKPQPPPAWRATPAVAAGVVSTAEQPRFSHPVVQRHHLASRDTHAYLDAHEALGILAVVEVVHPSRPPLETVRAMIDAILVDYTNVDKGIRHAVQAVHA